MFQKTRYLQGPDGCVFMIVVRECLLEYNLCASGLPFVNKK